MQSSVSSGHFEILLSSYDHEVHTALDGCLDRLWYPKKSSVVLSASVSHRANLVTLKPPPFFLWSQFSSGHGWPAGRLPGDQVFWDGLLQVCRFASLSLRGSFSSSSVGFSGLRRPVGSFSCWFQGYKHTEWAQAPLGNVRVLSVSCWWQHTPWLSPESVWEGMTPGPGFGWGLVAALFCRVSHLFLPSPSEKRASSLPSNRNTCLPSHLSLPVSVNLPYSRFRAHFQFFVSSPALWNSFWSLYW